MPNETGLSGASGSGGGGGGGGDASLAEQQTQSGYLQTIALAADVPLSDVIAAVDALGGSSTIADVVALLTTDATAQANILAKLTEVEVDTSATVASLQAIEPDVEEIRSDADATRVATEAMNAKFSQLATGFVAIRLSDGTAFYNGATAAKQPALGVAGTASTDVITVQGIAGGTPLPVSLSGTVTVDTEISVAATPTNNFTAPSAGSLYTLGMVFRPDLGTWNRAVGNESGQYIQGNTLIGNALNHNPVVIGGCASSTVTRIQTDATGRLIVTNARIARTNHITSAALPAAGAFTSQTVYTVPEGVVGITAYVSYTRGAVGGQVVLRPQWGNGTETAYEAAVVSSTSSDGVTRSQLNAREMLGPIKDQAGAFVFELEFSVPPGATTFALYAAEAGVTGTPGTIVIGLTARYGS